MRKTVVIVSAARTVIGKLLGKLSAIPATELGAAVIVEVVKRAGLAKQDIDEVIMGNVLPTGLGQNPAKQAALKAGLPVEVDALTVNEVCASGLRAVMLGVESIVAGGADIVVVGGMENMSEVPHGLFKLRKGCKFGDQILIDLMIRDGLWDAKNNCHMGNLAELVAKEFKTTREEADRFALASHEKALTATLQRKFMEEIVSVGVLDAVFDADEIPRKTSIEELTKLKPVFEENGQVTAGNSSPISDGAAALLIMSEEKARELGLKPLVRIIAQDIVNVDPKYLLVSPILGIKKILKKANLQKGDIDLYEINEAFACSTLVVIRELDFDEQRVNVRGGAVALGHPIGASGARILVTLFHEMKRSGAKIGLASICFGGGGTASMIIKKC